HGGCGEDAWCGGGGENRRMSLSPLSALSLSFSQLVGGEMQRMGKKEREE
ncbi:hypothetical protein L195_g008001, partial [Trifolium pratense]